MLLPLEEIGHNRISLYYFLQLHENLQLFWNKNKSLIKKKHVAVSELNALEQIIHE